MGATWWLDLTLMAVVFAVLGALRPLGDPDMPMHLALGEWIVRHRAVPLVEPFAWTRAGAPFYAYSWALEVPMYLAYSVAGPLGLRLLTGLCMMMAAASVFVLGRAARWQPWVTLSVAAFHTLIIALIVPHLRPQLLLLGLVPLGWALVYRMLEGGALWRPVAGLVAVNAVAANTHLFFPVMAAPLILCWLYPPLEKRRVALAVAAVVAGWMLSPYAPMWPRVFAFTFAPNAVMAQPSPVKELMPGFRAIASGGAAVPILALTLLPWALAGVRLTRREQLAAAALWLVGLLGFALAVRLLLVWWVLTIVPVAWAIGRREVRAKNEGPARAPVKVLFFAACVALLAVQAAKQREAWAFERGGARRLASVPARAIEPLAGWLDAHTRPGSAGRIYTLFDAGSYLVWRLPSYSSSIDGRGVFPDSVARVATYADASRRPVSPGPWRAADLAILVTSAAVTDSLDAAPEWTRAAYVVNSPAARDSVVLWVRNEWWARVGREPLTAGRPAAFVLHRPRDERR